MDNLDVASVFERIAELLELRGENPFRIRAYRNAARVVGTLDEPVEALVARDPELLLELPGIGKDLAGKIVEILRTGTHPLLIELATGVPPHLVDLLRVPGLGPKRAQQVHEALGIGTVDELEKAAADGRLRTLPRFGEATEKRILQGCRDLAATPQRCLLAEAEIHIRLLLAALRRTAGIEAVEVAGSFRRRRDTVGDIDILVAARRHDSAVRAFCEHPDVAQVVARGTTRCAIRLRSGLAVDLRIVRPTSFGAALVYFTGSQAHNIALRAMAKRRGLKVNEYGVFRGAQKIAGRSEEEVYAALDLPWIPPELREDRGEIAAAQEGRLPRLLVEDDLQGDLHLHSDATDGRSSLPEMLAACAARGYRYCAVTDHTKALAFAGGLDRAALRRQRRVIDGLRGSYPELTILHGAEVDILEDGTLDLDDATLAELDYVLVAVHSKMKLEEAAQTRRIVRALSHPRVHALAHPTCRILGRRGPLALDTGAVVAAAKAHDVWLEVDGQPDRLDLDDALARMAIDAGVRLVVDSDAHHVRELGFVRHAVEQARRGWCERRHVANALPKDELLAALARKRAL